MKLFYKEASNQHILFHTGNISAIVINKIGSMILVEDHATYFKFWIGPNQQKTGLQQPIYLEFLT